VSTPACKFTCLSACVDMCDKTGIIRRRHTRVCSVLQCVVLCCSVLQCVAVCCVLHHVAVCSNVLQCVTMCFLPAGDVHRGEKMMQHQQHGANA